MVSGQMLTWTCWCRPSFTEIAFKAGSHQIADPAQLFAAVSWFATQLQGVLLSIVIKGRKDHLPWRKSRAAGLAAAGGQPAARYADDSTAGETEERAASVTASEPAAAAADVQSAQVLPAATAEAGNCQCAQVCILRLLLS
jgi:hypothetical protein